MSTRTATILLPLLLTACASSPKPIAHTTVPQVAQQPRAAIANLTSASGSLVSGQLQLRSESGGVRIRGDIGGLSPNSSHGFHLHETGNCTAVDGSAAGGHFNPTQQPHGRSSAGPHHAGDSDNITADASGVAHVDVLMRGITLGSGAANDAAGRAFIVHAAADDYSSQPAGNAGARVACGVVQLR